MSTTICRSSFRTPVRTSVQKRQNRHAGDIRFLARILGRACREPKAGTDLPMKAQSEGPRNEENKTMKYILLMSSTKIGVDGYLTWSQKDRDAHMAVLQNLGKELTGSGEFVAKD